MEGHPRVRYYSWDAVVGVGLCKGRKMEKVSGGSNVVGSGCFWFPVNGGYPGSDNGALRALVVSEPACWLEA